MNKELENDRVENCMIDCKVKKFSLVQQIKLM